MARPASEFPTELELRILKILWDRAPLPVRDVRQLLADGGRELAHTSVITTLNTMVAKSFLKRRKDGKSFLFEPRVSRESIARGMIGDLVGRLFDGSASEVVLSLFDHDSLKADELKELRRVINRKIKEQDE